MSCVCAFPRPRVSFSKGRLGVSLVASAPTRLDGKLGKLLVGHHAALLASRFKRLGYAWEDFTLQTVAACVPPTGKAHSCALRCADFTPAEAICVALDTGAFQRLTGQTVTPLLARGYAWPMLGGGWVVPLLPPAHYRADPGLLATVAPDVAKAVRMAVGLAAGQPYAYDQIDAVWRPTRTQWEGIVREFLLDPSRTFAADIETPWKRRADMSEAEKASGEDLTQTIDEFNVTWRTDWGVSVPWTEEYVPGVIAMLRASQTRGTTLFWNGAYDMPRLTRHTGIVFDPHHTRDTKDLFRVWRNSVPRKLAVATSLIPDNYGVPPWKHLGTDSPVYRAWDVVALLRNDIALHRLVRADGADPAYDLFMRRLDPHLVRMSRVGLAVDASRVSRLVEELPRRMAEERAAMTAALTAPRYKVWKTRPAAERGLAGVEAAGPIEPCPGTRAVLQCGACGATEVDAGHVGRKTILEAV